GISGSKSGRGFEATFEVLPRLNEIKFGSGVIDELLFLDLPRECRFSSGIMMLEYGKAVAYQDLKPAFVCSPPTVHTFATLTFVGICPSA
ncbi:unnamed protein product, partial [Linum tenue]